MEEKIIELLNSFLGSYDKYSNGWYSYNCPCCAEENNNVPDDKYNLEVLIDPDVRGCGGYHCWRCGDSNGTKGILTKLVKKYGGTDVYADFVKVIKEYRSSRLYELGDERDALLGEFDEEQVLALPERCKSITKDTEAYSYLAGRGITDHIIQEYNIMYLGEDSFGQYKNRIVIPSYDAFGDLNFWVARDYTGLSKRKVMNPKKAKTEIAFNIGKVNWYEPLTIVEGPFDHIVTPNSVPLLGKSLDSTYMLYNEIVCKSRSDIRIFLDDDAVKDSYRLYKLLNRGGLSGRIYVVDTPDGYDPSLIFQEYGHKGILELLCGAKKLNDLDLIKLR